LVKSLDEELHHVLRLAIMLPRRGIVAVDLSLDNDDRPSLRCVLLSEPERCVATAILTPMTRHTAISNPKRFEIPSQSHPTELRRKSIYKYVPTA